MRRIVKCSAVELDDDALLSVPDVLVGGLAGRGAVRLTLARRQPVCPLNSMQITVLQHGTGSLAQICQHRLQRGAARDASTPCQGPQDPLRAGAAGRAGMRQYGEGCPHVAATELVGDDVDHCVLKANCGRTAMKFGTCLEIRRPVNNYPRQRSQVPPRRHRDMQDRGRRVRQCRCVCQRGGPKRQHPSPLTLCPGQPTGVIDVDTAIHLGQFAPTQQSSDIAVGAAGGNDLTARDDAILHPCQVLDMPEMPCPPRHGRQSRTTDRLAASERRRFLWTTR